MSDIDVLAPLPPYLAAAVPIAVHTAEFSDWPSDAPGTLDDALILALRERDALCALLLEIVNDRGPLAEMPGFWRDKLAGEACARLTAIRDA